MNKPRVALGLSGGVDSAVSASILLSSGYDVSCIYLNCYDTNIHGCRAKQDRKDALAVAMHLGLPFQVLDFRKEYQAAVIDYFKSEYVAGRTPNPDVICNRDIKFGLFLDWAIKNKFDYIATGHYADVAEIFPRKNFAATPASAEKSAMSRERIVRAAGEWQAKAGADIVLRIPRDLHKDQTYFLWQVPREKFQHVLFPLGNLLKTEVREMARKLELPVAEKKDSTGICFIGEIPVEEFLKRLGVKEKEGEVVIKTAETIEDRKLKIDVEARGSKVDQPSIIQPQRPSSMLHHPSSNYSVIGTHKGVWFYTIGQRHGFTTVIPAPAYNAMRSIAGRKAGISSKHGIPHHVRDDNGKDRPPFYVIDKDVKNNRLIVGFGAECYRDNFEVAECNWLIGEIGEVGEIRVRIRHGGDLIPCKIVKRKTQNVKRKTPAARFTNDDLPARNASKLACVAGGRFTIHVSVPQRGIAPGQSAVFYSLRRIRRLAEKASEEMVVLGGGVIQ